MSIDFTAKLSLKGFVWHVCWYGKFIDTIHDYVWEGEDEDEFEER